MAETDLAALGLIAVPNDEINIPSVIIYVTQIGFAFFCLTVVNFFPRALMLLLFLMAVLGYPMALAFDVRVYEFSPGSEEFENTLLKVMLVSLLATLPMLWFYQSQLDRSKLFGRFITFVLGANIAYTMLFEFSIFPDYCAIMRSVCCVLMCIALFLRLRLLEVRGQPVIYKTKPTPYVTVLFTPVTNLWVFAYTLWNISYSVSAFGVRTAMQILLVYIGVGYEKLKYGLDKANPLIFFQGYKLDKTYVNLTGERTVHDTPNAPPLGWHFGYARALTLGSYMLLLPYVGMIPYINSTYVTFEVQCYTEIGIYNFITLVLFVVDLWWAFAEYYDVVWLGKGDEPRDVEVAKADDI